MTMNPVPLRSRHRIRETERQGKRLGIRKQGQGEKGKEGRKTGRKRDKEWRRGRNRNEEGAKAGRRKAPKSKTRQSKRRAWQRRWRGGKGAGLEKGRISEKGLRMVQPKNRENGEREGEQREWGERVGP